MCRRPQAGRCSPPHRAAAGCRSSAAAENAYFLTESGCESVGNIPTFREFPARKSLPPFVTKRWRQKCPQDTSVGIGRRFSLSGHARSTPFAHTRSGRSNHCSICSASGAMRRMLCASRNDDYSVASVHGRPSARPIALLPLLFAVLDLLVLLDQAKSTRKLRKGRTSRSILREESRVFDGASAARSPFPIFRKAERWALCATIVCVISRTCNLRP